MYDRARRPSAQIAAAVCAVLRAMPICAPLAFIDVPAAVAQTPEGGALAADIPAQPLAQALAVFASQTGLQLVYVSEVVRSKNSRKAAAGLSAAQALTRMLRGTGLRFEYLTPHSIRILAAEPSPRATGTDPADDDLSEVIVTASRRDEHLLNVPMTIEVLAGETLARLNATTFDDYANYLPNVTAHGVGPNQNTIYMRGLGTGQVGIQGLGFSGSLPNVAVYLDEQSAQLPGRNLDLYTADLERIEVLEGPQGTLFGAGAEAGVLRYITNKPELNITEASVTAGTATTAHGASSFALSAVLNWPLITDTLAVRAVVYDEKRGGYIDNIPATFARSNSDVSIGYAGGTVPANSVVLKNTALVADNINPVTYSGVRAEALYQFSGDWNALIAQSYQRLEAEGVFAEETVNSFGQAQPDLTAQLYNPSYNKDWFENTALTLSGRAGPLKLLYAGAYLVRNIEQVQDYTGYARGGLYADYYQCIPGPTPPARCFSPSTTWHNKERNTHQSHELRISTPDDWRLRAVGGVFYENFAIYDQTDFFYLTAIPYFNPIAPPTDYWTYNGSPFLPNGSVACGCVDGTVLMPGAPTLNNPNARPPGDGFFEDVTRGYKQKAVYASVDFDVIPHTLTVSAGTRYSSTESWQMGALMGSFGCQIQESTNPCRNNVDFINFNALGLDRTYASFKSRASFSWKPREDALIYYTWSQGFRPGFFNRGFGTPGSSPLYAPLPGNPPAANQAQAVLHGGWQQPLAVAPDTLTNNELGWKTNWMDEHLQWNGALYQERWNNVQLDTADPAIVGSASINGGDYRVRGLETSMVARMDDGLTLELGAAWNHSELVKEAVFYWLDGTPINFNVLGASGGKLPNPAGALGSPLAGAPSFRANLRARYERSFNGYDAFAQLAAAYQSSSLSSNDRLQADLQGNPVSYALPSFTTFDGALGIGRGGWLLQLYGENLTDTRAELYANYRQFYKAITVNRPRTIGLRFSYRIRSS